MVGFLRNLWIYDEHTWANKLMRFSSSVKTSVDMTHAVSFSRMLRKTVWLQQRNIGQQLDSIFFLDFRKATLMNLSQTRETKMSLLSRKISRNDHKQDVIKKILTWFEHQKQ